MNEVIDTGNGKCEIRAGQYRVPIEYNSQESKTQLIEMAKWVMRKKLAEQT